MKLFSSYRCCSEHFVSCHIRNEGHDGVQISSPPTHLLCLPPISIPPSYLSATTSVPVLGSRSSSGHCQWLKIIITAWASSGVYIFYEIKKWREAQTHHAPCWNQISDRHGGGDMEKLSGGKINKYMNILNFFRAVPQPRSQGTRRTRLLWNKKPIAKEPARLFTQKILFKL